MSEFRRNYQPGGTFFFTVVTCKRQPILCNPSTRRILHQVIKDQQTMRPFDIEAIVLLPEHLHTIWTLPKGDTDYSMRWASIKANFTRLFLQDGGYERMVCKGQSKENRRGVWQPRYMEHTIRDEDDLFNHVNYIHYNPVKHGLVDTPVDWQWSSFHRYAKQGSYSLTRGCRTSDVQCSIGQVDDSILE